MNAKENSTYYRLELDDYSAAAFTSFGKYYYGTMEDLRCFFGELTIDEEDWQKWLADEDEEDDDSEDAIPE